MQTSTLRSLPARDGTKLIADVWNVNANSTLLLLPAGAETRSVWHPVVDHFPTDSKNRWRFVAADHRGHGSSGRSESYLFKDFIDDLLTWIAELSARPLVVAGGSIGGALAMVAAGEGAAIDGLAMLDVPIVPALERVMLERRRIQEAARTGHASIASIDPKYVGGGGLIEDVFKDIDRWKRAACRLTIPTLLIAGDSGVVRTPELEQFRVHVPHGEIEHLQTGHLVARDDPKGVAAVLDRFLNRHWGQ
jgi:pimeloyl-ACP methyl ester carboxylesterase